MKTVDRKKKRQAVVVVVGFFTQRGPSAATSGCTYDAQRRTR
jgi:hypothetical protein